MLLPSTFILLFTMSPFPTAPLSQCSSFPQSFFHNFPIPTATLYHCRLSNWYCPSFAPVSFFLSSFLSSLIPNIPFHTIPLLSQYSQWSLPLMSLFTADLFSYCSSFSSSLLPSSPFPVESLA